MSWLSTLVTVAAKDVKGWFTKEIPTLTAEAKSEFDTIAQSMVAFVATDFGKMATDAVNTAKASGQTGSTAFATAKATFIADAKTAGHDLENIGSGILDWMVQTAYTVADGVVASLVTSDV